MIQIKAFLLALVIGQVVFALEAVGVVSSPIIVHKTELTGPG